MEESKTIILGSFNKKDQAILNLKTSSESEIKFFNFGTSQNKNFALGIKQGDDVIKVPLTIKNNLCKFKLPSSVNLQNKLLCAVVDVSNAFCPEIVLSGSNNSKIENNQIENVFVNKKPDDTSVLYENDCDEEINKLVDKNIQDDFNSTYFDSCANCKYREAFYNDVQGVNSCIKESSNYKHYAVNKLAEEKGSFEDENNADIGANFQFEQNTNNIEESDFYEQIKAQIDVLFTKNKEDDILPKIISNSKWVRINYDDNNFYVLGLIFDEDKKVNFISYGVPSNDKNNPPDELKDFAQWLPIENNSQQFLGYWLVYQSAKNGETIKVDYM